MIYIKIDNDVFYDDAVVLVRSFYPRTEVMALKADSKPEEKDEKWLLGRIRCGICLLYTSPSPRD